MPSNIFCSSKDLVNEADVEQKFVNRLIKELAYEDSHIKPKFSLSDLTVRNIKGQGEAYKPDYAIKVGAFIKLIIEAKSPKENLESWIWQPRGYTSLLNGQYTTQNPTEYFLITNGTKTRLYKWDVTEPVLELAFEDFAVNNQRFNALKELIAFASIKESKEKTQKEELSFILKKKPLEEVNSAFAWCHQYIYKKDNISQAAAFTEFVKVIFLKLLSDRKIRDDHPEILWEQEIEVSAESVKFSVEWINKHQDLSANPLNSIQFKEFNQQLETEVQIGKRKRIFNVNEEINLSPETIKGVVGKIESIFLFGIDADLNGRLFETFLNATMRGKDLGQFFTPRSVVKLAVKLANLKVGKAGNIILTDRVIDACCGTGGFLIDVLAEMWNQVDTNGSLSQRQKDELKKDVANNRIFGVDIGREPPLARIARLNMYLHGDGGTRIFQVDALDKKLEDKKTDSAEILLEKSQLKELFTDYGYFDVAITNPPFAKVYERSVPTEAKILDEYALGIDEGGRNRATLKTSLMFIERYYDLLKVGGRLVTIIDDGILNGNSYTAFRDFLRQRFIINGIISLPGDAFQRSKARVKTSILIATKREIDDDTEQPNVFMYPCEYIGIDDPSRQRFLPIDRINRKKAVEEINIVSSLFSNFLNGTGNVAEFIVDSRKVQNRLDVKSCLLKTGRKVDAWKKHGWSVCKLEDLCEEKTFPLEDIISTRESDDSVTYLRVKYDGTPDAGDEIPASETTYQTLYKVRANDVVISNIAASYGSVALIDDEHDGLVIANEYTVLNAKSGIHPILIWLLLRSPEIKAEMLITSTGIARSRIKWDSIKSISVPKLLHDELREVVDEMERSKQLMREAQEIRLKAIRTFEKQHVLQDEDAFKILRAFKPPK